MGCVRVVRPIVSLRGVEYRHVRIGLEKFWLDLDTLSNHLFNSQLASLTAWLLNDLLNAKVHRFLDCTLSVDGLVGALNTDQVDLSDG